MTPFSGAITWPCRRPGQPRPPFSTTQTHDTTIASIALRKKGARVSAKLGPKVFNDHKLRTKNAILYGKVTAEHGGHRRWDVQWDGEDVRGPTPRRWTPIRG